MEFNKQTYAFIILIVLTISLIAISTFGLTNQAQILNANVNVYEDILSPIINIASTQQAPTFDATIQSYLFHNDIITLQDYVYVNLQLPHAYKEGSDIYCHVHWLPTSANTGAINLSLDYTWTNFNETQTGTTTITATQNATGNLKHQIIAFPTINGSRKTISSVFKGKLTRQSASASDTYTGNAALDFFDCHYLKDSLGSLTEYGKWG